MKCPHCGERTDVLQTFAHETHVVRVRGHRSQEKCWYRSKSIERYDTYASDKHVENAKPIVLELSRIINQLKDFDIRIKRALNMDTLVNLLDTDDENSLFLPGE